MSLDLLTKKCVTCFSPHVEHLHPFDLGQWSCMASHVINTSTKFEDLTAIQINEYDDDDDDDDDSWVMSSGIFTMRLQPLRMSRITWPMCRDKFSHIFEIPDPDLLIHYTIFMALRLRQMELSAKTMYCPVLMLKTTHLSAHVQNHVSIERCRKSFTIIVLGDHDFPLTTSTIGNLTAFRAILAIFHGTCTEMGGQYS